MKRTSVLVTGGAGFIGSHLTRRLLEDGSDVRVVDNFSTGFRRNLDEVWDRIDFLQGDIEEPRVAGAAVEGVDIVFHLAALPSVPRSMKDPIATHRTNVNGTLQLLESSRRSGVRRFVYSSSSSAYGDTEVLPKAEDAEPLPRSPYAASKVAGELYTLAYARAGMIEGVALRYFNVFGPRQDPNGPYAAVIPLIFRSAMNGVPLTIYGDGEQTRDFTYVDNVVDGNMLAASGPAPRVNGHCVNLGAGGRLSLLELVRLVEEVVGRPVQRQHAPPRSGDVRDSQAHLERANAVLGYTPRVSVREGIARLWEWYQSDPVTTTAA